MGVRIRGGHYVLARTATTTRTTRDQSEVLFLGGLIGLLTNGYRKALLWCAVWYFGFVGVTIIVAFLLVGLFLPHPLVMVEFLTWIPMTVAAQFIRKTYFRLFRLGQPTAAEGRWVNIHALIEKRFLFLRFAYGSLQIGIFMMQFSALTDATQSLWHVPGFLSLIIMAGLRFVPIVGQLVTIALTFYGAYHVWHLPWWEAAPVAATGLFFLVSFQALRGLLFLRTRLFPNSSQTAST